MLVAAKAGVSLVATKLILPLQNCPCICELKLPLQSAAVYVCSCKCPFCSHKLHGFAATVKSLKESHEVFNSVAH